MTEKCNRYINKKQRSAKHSLQKLTNWKPMKLPPQVVLMRLKCMHPGVSTTSNREKEEEAGEDESSGDQLSPELRRKIEELQCLLHHSPEQSPFLQSKTSLCFWCTCESAAPAASTFFIPVRVNPESRETTGYGHFCSPNCALAWLYSENSVSPHEKHERDQLIHLLFLPEGSTERFRPSPDPRLLLDKFTGNLTEEEYKQLFQSDLFLFPTEYHITRQWKEMPEMTDSKLCQFYGKNFQGFRTGFLQKT